MDMKLVFLLSAWLVHVGVFSYSEPDGPEADIRKMYDRISEEMLSALTSSMNRPPNHRQKRDTFYETQSLIDDSGVHRLSSVKPVAKLCHPAIRTLFIDVNNVTYSICLSEATSDTPAEVVVGIYKEHTWTPTYSWMVQNPTDVSAFHYKKYLYVLVTDKNRETGTDLVRINIESGNVVSDHMVDSSYSTAIAIFKMKTTYNMAIANSVLNKDSLDLSTQVTVYEWRETYFDKNTSFPAYYVTDIEPFKIHGASFIAVANFKKGMNSPDVDSEIFRYLDDSSWTSYQKIRTYGAMDWEFFTLGVGLGQDFFLAVANKGIDNVDGNSMIYKFVDDKFLPFQCLQTTKATSIASYSMGSTFVLAVANENDAVHLYQYDGWLFVKSIQFTRGAMSYGVVHLDFHKVLANSQNAVILSVSNPKHPNYQSVFEMGFTYENYLEEWHGKSTDWCIKILSKIENTDIDKSIGGFEDVIFTDQPEITIHGDVTFENGFEAETLKTPKLTEVSTEQTYDDNLLIKLANLQARLEAVKEKLYGFSNFLKHSLKIDGTQNITSHLEFQDAVFDCKTYTCQFKNIHTDVLNGEDITDWAHQLVFLDSNQVINGTLYAKGVNATSIHAHGLVDGVKVEHLVTKSGNHNVTGHKTFNDLITVKDLEVSGKVDGIRISSDEVLLVTGHQTIYGNLTFDDVHTTWLKAKNVNGRDFTKFYNDLVFIDKPSIITGEKIFGDVAVTDLVLGQHSKINEVDLLDLWENVLWTDGNQEIKAEMTFSDVVMNKNLDVLHGINGIEIPGPRVVDITEPGIITAPYIFESPTKISRLEVLKSLNGLPLVHAPDGSKQLDIMLKSGDQVVTGSKIFHSIHLDANSYVQGTVDGVDLSEFADSVLRKDTSVTTNGTWVFNNLVVKGPLTVDGKVSGYNLRDVYDRALKLNDTQIPEMVFNDLVTVEELESRNINDIDVGEDLVLKSKPQAITGKKVFKKVILEEDSVVNGLVNNKNLSFFNEVLLRIGNQTINSKVFKRNVVIKDLTVTGSINGVPVSEMMSLSGGQIFGSRNLRNVSFTNIEARNVALAGKVNGIDVQEMIDDTMTYDGFEKVLGTKNVTGTIYVSNGSNLLITDLNGIDVRELWDDAVFVDVPQNITGEKTFTENAIFNHLSFDTTLDGVSRWDMQHNWMRKNSSQTVEGNVVFAEGFTAGDLVVGTVNGVDLERLNSEIVKTNEAAEIEGPVIFENSVISNGDISLTGTIQGIDFSEEAVLRDNVLVTAEKKFLNDIVIDGDLTVDGTVDGINVQELCSSVILGNKEQNISRLVIKGDVTFVAGGSVGGNIAGVDLKLLQEVAVKNDGSPIKFTDVKTFENVTFEGPVTIKGKFGNVDLKILADKYMSLTKDQDIPAAMQFSDISVKGVLSAQSLNTDSKSVNGINLQELNARILKTTGTQNVTASYTIDDVYFEDDVFVSGKVNGLDVPSGLMRHNHTNYIQSVKVFEKPVIVFGNLDMESGKKIQGVDVSDWAQKAVLKDGKFDIHGFKTFHHLELNDVIVEGLLDGLNISEDHLLMTYGDQVVTGTKTIVGNVSIEGSLVVDGLINGVNLVNLSMETLQRDRNNTVTGAKTFSKPLTVVSLQAPSVAGVDVVKLQAKLNTALDFEDLEFRFDEIESVMSNMQKAFDNQAVIFQYYELYDAYDIPTAYNWLYVPGRDNDEMLLLFDNSSSTAPCSSIRIFNYDQNRKLFIPAKQEIMTSYAVAAKSLLYGNSTYLFVANQNPHSSCSSIDHVGKSTIDIYTWERKEFKKIQSLVVFHPLDFVVFDSGHSACLVVLEYTGTSVHCFGDISKPALDEVLHTTGSRKVSVITSMGQIFLAIAAEDATIPRNYLMEGQKHIDIYMFDAMTAKFSAPKQVIQSTFVQSVALMSYKDKYSRSESLFLAVAEGSIPSINNEPKIIIYRCGDPSTPFQKYQVLMDYGVLDWISLNTGELLLFAVDSLKGQIKVYQYKGASGFVKIDTVKSIGTTALHPFVRSRPEDWYNHYLALAGPRSTLAQPSQGIDYAKILKSKVKGKRAFH